ncbi:concanavalin A-like lectin/glucanase domain, Xyloglucan endotransglucosylase/hydrolase [Artemisia annua]|uniref:Concanavalin A-like lectin/glucanase domain, Xyloglucan endotransglucosylase/hydrolase n=1 Tax=Artemisia annua TaxID=35608 RepID=A0A2U1NFA6_ARTAN|nr:concanavalin A-like lectin/glucanase domain, Xyloglucan endotransglucosylase/hydrolase [Artemisia annua]
MRQSKACAVALTISCLILAVSAGSFYEDMDITFGGERAKIINGGQDLSLSLDQYSGSGFQSKNEYLFGRLDEQELSRILVDDFHSVDFLIPKRGSGMKTLKLVNFKLKTVELNYCRSLKSLELNMHATS